MFDHVIHDRGNALVIVFCLSWLNVHFIQVIPKDETVNFSATAFIKPTLSNFRRKLQVCPGEFSYFKPGEEVCLIHALCFDNVYQLPLCLDSPNHLTKQNAMRKL